MNIRHRRTAALLAAVAVTGVTGAGIVAGTASAAGTGTCTENVNVRSEPSKTAPVVGTCEKGESTSLGASRNGFVKLDEFGGWASEQFIEEGSAGTTAPNSAEDDEASTPRSGTGSTTSPERSDIGTSPERSGVNPERADTDSDTDTAGTDSDTAGTGTGGTDTERPGTGAAPGGSLLGS